MEVNQQNTLQPNADLKILIIDDDQEDYMIARDMLAQARGGKWIVDWAESYETGREKLFSGDYRAVLVDYDLGPRSGLELIREAAGRSYPAPLILFTGRGSYEVDLEAMQAGATLYLTKDEANPLLLERSIRYAIEMKQKEQSLLESEDRLRKVIENVDEGLIVVGPDGNALSWNPAALTLHGYSSEEDEDQLRFLERTTEIYELVTLDGRVLTFAEWPIPRILNGETLRDLEYRLRHKKKGWEKIFSYGGTLIRDRQGHPWMGVLTIRDVTERRRAEQTLRESEERLAGFLESTHDSFFALDNQWRILYVNQRFCEIVSKQRDELIGANFWERMPIYLGTEVEQHYRRAMNEKVPLEFQAGGFYSSRWYDVTIYPTQNGISVFATDRTEEMAAQQTLRKSEAQLRHLFETSVIGIMERDTEGAIHSANEAFLKMIGYTREDLESGALTINHLLPEEWKPVERQIMEEVRALGVSRPYEKEFIRKDGSRVPVMVGHTRLDGDKMEIFGFVMDLTELKETQDALQSYAERLKYSNQELEQFAFVASHDLQEPLRKILIFGEQIDRRLHAANSEGSRSVDDTTLDYLTRMLNATQRMQGMIHSLLELSRITIRGKTFETVDLSEVAEEVISDLEGRIEKENGRVEVGPLPAIEADPLQMHQLLLNLIGNALKFHKPGQPPIVKVSGEVTAAHGKSPLLKLIVADSGIGFDQADADKIFQPFFRLNGRSEYEGTGMGLAICYKIVERHQGTITSHSQPGEGTSFEVTLPMKQKS